MRERKNPRRGFAASVCVVAFLVATVAVRAEPIRSIFIEFDQTDSLVFDYDGNTSDGTLTIGIDSFNVLVERDDPVQPNEFFNDASFELTATSLSDQSNGSRAAGVFDSVSFTLRDSVGDVLLSGERASGSGLIYGEAVTLDTMLFSGGFVTITGGTLAGDFDIAADLFGFGSRISPGTDTFDLLNTDHGGSVSFSLLPVPEPATALMLTGLAIIGLVRRSRVGR